jgi:pSer/pThr/pTyr-binding forkhead associated (FHA) protein
VLDDPCNVVAGRSGDADLILVEGMVSRRHTRFAVDQGLLTIEDLDSTNGTFINGDKVKSRRLQEGDRVLIGTTILKVVFSESPLGTKPPPPSSGPLDDVATADRGHMAGQLSEVSVPELIEMFGSSRQRLVLEIDGSGGKTRVTIADGRVLDCTNVRLPDAPALKCVLRVLGYTKGTFAVRTFRQPSEARLDIPIPELLVDGLFKLDEKHVLRQRLPEGDDKLVLARPMAPMLNALSERDLDLLQVAHNAGSVEAALDQSPDTDLDTAKRLLALIDGGYLRKA